MTHRPWHRARTDRRRIVIGMVAAGVVLVAVVVVGTVVLGGAGESRAGSGLRFGVLGSSCDPTRAPALAGAGVELAQVNVSWDRFEPAPGRFDPGYRAEVARMLENCRRAGLGVVLSVGFQAAPAWVSALPAGAYRNQYGQAGPADVPNLAFSAAARQAAREYLDAFARAFPLDGFAAVRVGTGDNGELGYATGASPDPSAFWAFDDAAQSGAGLAEGVAVSPMPGWAPGQEAWQGRPVGVEQVRGWYGWYTAAITGAVNWQIHTLRELGYRGAVHVPLAGRGALPADLETALLNRLDGTGVQDSSIQTGLYYPDQIAAVADANDPAAGPVLIDTTGLDDATAVNARRLSPPQDTCRPTDADAALDPDTPVGDWAASRWTVALAKRAGLGAVGENPGSPSAAGTGGHPDSDEVPQQLVHAPRYAQDCGLSVLMWAFEDDLFGGSPDFGLPQFSERIRETR